MASLIGQKDIIGRLVHKSTFKGAGMWYKCCPGSSWFCNSIYMRSHWLVLLAFMLLLRGLVILLHSCCCVLPPLCRASAGSCGCVSCSVGKKVQHDRAQGAGTAACSSSRRFTEVCSTCMTQYTDDQISSFFNCVEVNFVCVSGFVHVFPQSHKFCMPAS